ncbi:MAG: GT4 family glycosyltransferase PelF [Candidatus Odinarchaeia archaeon]
MARICLITEGTYPYNIGGVSQWVHQLISGMKEHEFVLVSITADTNSRPIYDLPSNVKEHIVLPIWSNSNIEVSENKNADKIRKSLLNIVANEKCIRDTFLRPIEALLDFNIPKADLYHAVNAGYAGLLGLMGKIRHRSPLLVTEHGSYYKEWLIKLSSVNFPVELHHPKIIRPQDHPQIKILRFIRKLCNMTLSNANIIAPVTKAHIPLEVRLGANPNKIKPIPNGIDLSNFKPNGDKNKLVVGTVARLNPIKDVITLIKAARIVSNKLPNAVFKFIGPVEDLNYYQQVTELIEKYRLTDIFQILPETRNPEKTYHEFAVFALTSLSEAQPLSILEAMACGKPVVATRVGGVPEPVSGRGILVNPGDFKKLASALTFFLKNRKEAKIKGEKGREIVGKNYSVNRFINDYKETYASLLEKKH